MLYGGDLLEQIIYADVLFIVNFSMDFLSLYMTALLLHKKTGFCGLVFASGIGAFYGVVSLFQNGAPLIGVVVNIAVAALMCFIAYGSMTMVMLIRNTLIFYGISFLMGGIMTAIYTLANKGLSGRGIVINGDVNTLHSSVSPAILALLAAAAVCISYICSKLMKNKISKERISVKLRFCDKQTGFSGIADSGNLLTEPLGGLPVIVCSYTVLEPVLPLGIRPLFKECNVGLIEFADPEFVKKIRIIPISHIGGKGLIIGIIPDELSVNGRQIKACVACSVNTEHFGETDSAVPASVIE